MAARRKAEAAVPPSDLLDCQYAANRLTACLIVIDEAMAERTDLHDKLEANGVLSAFLSEILPHAISMSAQLATDLERLEEQEKHRKAGAA